MIGSHSRDGASSLHTVDKYDINTIHIQDCNRILNTCKYYNRIQKYSLENTQIYFPTITGYI